MMADLAARRHHSRLPADPTAFVHAAERVTNAHSLEEILAVYSSEPVLEMVTEGASARHEGQAAVREAWVPLVDAFAREQFAVHKTLIAASNGVIVNAWTGGTRRSASMQGLEVWMFDDQALVSGHLMHTFVDVHPATSLRARLRLLFASPRLSLSLLSAERRAARGVR